MALLAAYSFDETGDTVVDYSGNGNDFSIASTDGTRNAGGHTNGGLSWTNTAGGYPTLPDIGRTADRTIMAWLKDVPLLGTSWSVIFNAAALNSGAWGILFLSGTTINIQARNTAGFVRATATLPNDGSWHHVAGTYDGTTVRCYVDAVEGTSAELTGPIRTDTDPPQLLVDWNLTTPVMDDVRLYDSVLSQAAIETAMNTPVGALVGALVVGSTSHVWHPGRGPTRARFAVTPRATDSSATVVGSPDSAELTEGAGSISATVTTADSATAADTASVLATPTATDSATVSEAATVAVTGTVADDGSLADSATISVTLTATDTAALSETASVTAVVADSDTATLADSASLAATSAIVLGSTSTSRHPGRGPSLTRWWISRRAAGTVAAYGWPPIAGSVKTTTAVTSHVSVTDVSNQ